MRYLGKNRQRTKFTEHHLAFMIYELYFYDSTYTVYINRFYNSLVISEGIDGVNRIEEKE